MQEGKALAERLRKTVEETLFNTLDVSPARKITVSIGIAAFPGDATLSHGLVESADRALYRAKEMGRNKVCLASENTTPKKNRYTC